MIIQIKDAIFEYAVRNKLSEDIPVYSVTNEKGFCTGYFSKEVASKDKSTYKIVPKGYFAYNPSRINVGSIDWQNCEDKVIVSPLYVVFGVSEELDQQYLLHYLKSDMMLTYIKEYATGSVRDNLKLSDLGKFPINLRPLDEQRKIAAVLDKVSDLIAKRRQQLDKLDELIKARFVEMFGHQSHNEKSLPYMTINDVAEIYLGITHTPTYVENGVMFISAKNTSGDFLDLSDVKYISREEFESAPRGSKPKVNDVLFSRVGSNLGHPVILEDDLELCIFVSLGFLRTKGKVTSNYLKHWMRDDFFAHQVAEHVKGGGQPNLNTGWLKEFKIIVPDLEQQKEFDEYCNRVEKSKLTIQKSLEKLETLKKALMQEYFG